MRKLSFLIAGLALTCSLRGGDFKRFYPANAGERIVSLTALPGGGLWLKSRVEKGGGEISRVLVPSLHRVYRIPEGLTPLAAAAESGILLQQGDTLYFRSLVKAGIFLRYEFIKNYPKLLVWQTDNSPYIFQFIYRNEETGCEVSIAAEGVSPTRKCGSTNENSYVTSENGIHILDAFVVEKGAFIFRPKKNPHEILSLEPADSGKTIIEWGQTAEIGWAVTSISRNLPLVPPRRQIKVFSAVDGVQLANTQIAKEAPEKGLAVAFKMKPDAPDGLAVITGGGMQWWTPKGENIDDWGEITLDLATAKPAE